MVPIKQKVQNLRHVGCSQASPKSPVSETVINLDSESSYADYVNVGGKHYINAWELTLVETAGMTEIGEVERGSVIAQGTPVYEIEGYPEQIRINF